MNYRRSRFGRYLKMGYSKSKGDNLIEISFSSNGSMWNTISLTKHELRKLVKHISKFIQDENLSKRL